MPGPPAPLAPFHEPRRTASALAVVAAAAALSGCGGSDGSDAPARKPSTAGRDSQATTAKGGNAPDRQAGRRPADRQGSRGHGSASRGSGEKVAVVPPGPPPKRVPTPVPKEGDTSIQTYGRAAPDADFVAVANAVRAYHLAAASGEAGTACALLASELRAQMARLSEAAGADGASTAVPEEASCEDGLGRMLGARSPASRRQLRRIRVTDARVKGDSGFAIYRMPGGGLSALTVRREGGAWKLAALGGVPLQ